MSILHAAVPVFLCVALAGAAGEPPSVTERAGAMARRGEIDSSIDLLQKHMEGQPGDVPARLLLGHILVYDGRPDEAEKAWREGLTQKEADLPLLMALGGLLRKQGEDGPTVTYRRGTVTCSPSTDEARETAYKKEKTQAALAAYQAARQLKADDDGILSAMAGLQSTLGQHEEALKTWAEGSRRFPANADYELGWAASLQALDRNAEAETHYRAALLRDGHRVEAYEALAALCGKRGEADPAGNYARRAEFYRWVPAGIPLEFSDGNFALYRVVEAGDRLDRKDKDAQEAFRRKREEQIGAWIAQPSETGNLFISVLCHHHEDCGRLECEMYAALEKQGRKASDLLLVLLRTAQSTCTARSAAAALARMKDDRVLGHLLRLLPGDTRSFAHMDIAGALDSLGDPRAVAPLIEVLQPAKVMEKPAEQDNPMMWFEGLQMARARAALALGAFDTPESRQALEAGLGNPQVKAACLAALYRLTRDEKRFGELKEALGKQDSLERTDLIFYLKKIDTDSARRYTAEREK